METENQENGTPERTIEQIASEFNETVQQPQQQAPVSESYATLPDPALEPERFAEAVQQENVALKTQVSDVNSRLSNFENNQKVETTKQAISSAVDQVNEVVKQDPDIVESFLNVRYNNDKQFAKIWDNRDQNPSALKEALSVVSRDMQDKFAVVRDPQIAEDQRAINEATRSTNQSVSRDSVADKMEKLNDAEFDIEWNKLAGNH